MDKRKLASLLPPVSSLDIASVSCPLTYIAAAGFEDRATSVLDFLSNEKCKIQNALVIEYKPYGHPENRVTEIRRRLERIGASIMWASYNRRDPQEFQTKCANLLRSTDSTKILVDISGMSKFLIMVLLQSLRKIPRDLSILYAEADIYHPTREEFEKEKNKNGATPDFLTTGVYNILTVTSLSSVSMQGYPILMLVFPTFNHFEIVALHNEFSPQRMILLEGDPHEERDKWRLAAIREVNKNILDNPDYACESKTLSTFDYVSTVEALEEVYQTYCYSHKIVLAPTGSKLQTIAAFVFKQLHPDVQIVYPITEAFIGEYSEKCRGLWSIHVGNFSRFVDSLNSYELRLEKNHMKKHNSI
jgi:hypothetical protein